MKTTSPPAAASLIDSRVAAWRLLASLGAVTLGGSGMYVMSVALTTVQHEFGVDRSIASLPYTAMMIGFGIGGMVCGRWADRYGVDRVVRLGAIGSVLGYVLASLSSSIVLFTFAHAALLGFLAVASSFVPLMADTALWWNRRRGIAVAVVASGNYVAGAVWPPIAQWGMAHVGWRTTYVALGVVCGLGMALLSLLLRQRPPALDAASASSAVPGAGLHASARPFGLQPTQAQWLLFVAGIGCCVAMAMPQVHIVAYCMDLGYGPANGARMLSTMLGFGIVSRLVSGWIADRIGGLRTMLLGSALQGVALCLFLPFDGIASLYLISALFGLFQGGIVPSYAIVIREYFAPQEASARVGTVIMGTLIGMALGGWLSGKVFDLTGSYHAAFVNGIGWNLLNLGIVGWLFLRTRARERALGPPAAA
ncbi:MAG: MFS transporter [Proteobacteria bacterium]|nr:MFS transporter [Pseudomonadota bacterium]